MKVQLDTNILARLVLPTHPHHGEALQAKEVLERRGDILRICPQNLFEFWVIATRPIENQGLGLTVLETVAHSRAVKLAFSLDSDESGLLEEWETIVEPHQCKGKIAHDARIVASMNLRGITHLLTFNVKDFHRFEGITVLNPPDVGINC